MTRNPTEKTETPVRRFRAAVARFGDRPAVHGPSGTWTYRELDAASDALAARIRPVAGRGDRVALLYGHDIEVVAAVLAVLKAGAACLPLDPQQPKARLAATVTGADPVLVLADAAHGRAAERLAGGRPVLAVSGDGPAPGAPLEPDDSDPGDSPDAPALVLLTPGSGGTPEGDALTGRYVLAQALRFARLLGLTAEDRVPVIASYASDGSVPDLFAALLTGASLHVINPYTTPPSTLLGDLVRQRVTVLHGAPALLRLFFVQLAAGAPAPAPRAVVIDGEMAMDSDVAGVARHFPGAALLAFPGAESPDGPGTDAYAVALRHRSEPAEAEVLLRAHPTVRHAAVVADPDLPPDRRLVGYLTSPGPQAASPEELLRYLRGLLPDYAVPTRLVVLPKLPTDPAGGLDRSRLPALPEAASEMDDTPRTTQERRLATLWSEVLARESAALGDHFFACGGDSARVMKLLSRAGEEYGVAVPMPPFLAEPTLRTLVSLVADSTRAT